MRGLCPQSGSKGCVPGEAQMPQTEALHAWGWQNKWPLTNASLLFFCLSLILIKTANMMQELCVNLLPIGKHGG